MPPGFFLLLFGIIFKYIHIINLAQIFVVPRRICTKLISMNKANARGAAGAAGLNSFNFNK